MRIKIGARGHREPVGHWPDVVPVEHVSPASHMSATLSSYTALTPGDAAMLDFTASIAACVLVGVVPSMLHEDPHNDLTAGFQTTWLTATVLIVSMTTLLHEMWVAS